MKTIEVVAAIIHHDGKILATQRGYGDFKDGWEFPGGKMEAGETAEHAIVREIEEELNVEIRPEKLLHTVEYDYPNFHLTMHCFISVITKGTIELIEHEDAKWLKPEELDSVAWLPADVEVVEKLKVYLKEKTESKDSTWNVRAAVGDRHIYCLMGNANRKALFRFVEIIFLPVY